MPEISQDAFEILNPGTLPATPIELRARSNSLQLNEELSCSSCSKTASATANTEVRNGTASPSFSSTLHANSTDISANVSLITHDVTQHTQQHAIPTPSFVVEHDMDQSLINGISMDTYHGYKRELDHRVYYNYVRVCHCRLLIQLGKIKGKRKGKERGKRAKD